MRKAQIQHVFLYLFALLIIGVLVIIGYQAITKITSAGCQADQESFKSELLSRIEQYDARGSLHVEKMHAPCGATQICFLDSDTILGSEGVTGSAPPLVQDAADSNTPTNVWTSKSNSWEAVGYSEKIEIESTDNFVCIKAKGSNFNIQFDGLGRRTRVSAPT